MQARRPTGTTTLVAQARPVADREGVDPAIDIAVLGPVALHIDGTPVALGRSKRATLLAWLALHAGSAVSLDATVEVLWPGTEPSRSRNRLGGVLSNLRRAIGPDREVAHRRHGRLFVELDPEAVDATRLERAVVQAHRALSRHAAPKAAIWPLRQALDRWRALPYPELAHHPAGMAEQARLTKVRIDALELLHATRLRDRADTTITADVHAVTAEHPLREVSWRQLMVALDANGRHIEALRAFQACRSALAGAGRTPSAATLAVERALLERRRPSPDLLLPEPVVAPAARSETRTSDGPSDVAGRWLAHGGSRLVVIEARPASGSPIARSAADGVRAAGGVVVELDGQQQHAIASVIDHVHAQLADDRPPAATERAGDADSPVITRPRPWQAARELARQLGAAAERAPVAMVVRCAHRLAGNAPVALVVDEVLQRRAPLLVVAVVDPRDPGSVALRARADEIVSG